jgi:hypothetical protein
MEGDRATSSSTREALLNYDKPNAENLEVYRGQVFDLYRDYGLYFGSNVVAPQSLTFLGRKQSL